jgi:hypothetical protein
MGEDTKKMDVGDILTLTGKTKHGKNRVREQGALWRVTQTKVARRHSVHPEGTPIALLRALSNPDKHWRWIRQTDDLNFMVEETKNNE